MKQYPIWIQVAGSAYKASKSFGARGTESLAIYVGSSSKHSALLGTVKVVQLTSNAFALVVDGNVIKNGLFDRDTNTIEWRHIPVNACEEEKAGVIDPKVAMEKWNPTPKG